MPTLSEEILEDIYREVEKIVGTKSVNLFKRKISEKGIKEVSSILFELAGEMENLFGSKGAYSVLREVGRSVAKDLMNQHPNSEWEEVFEKGLNIMGFAQGVQKEEKRACICNCIFYPNFLERKNIKPTEHPICWIGWGFIEGFMRVFTGATGVKFAGRDFEKKQCWFEIVKL